METIVLKSHLKEGLEVVEHAAAKSPSLPILSNILLSVKKEEVTLAATDLQMGITYQFLGTSKEEGSVVFPGRFLVSLLAVSSDEKVVLARRHQTLLVSIGNHSAELQTMDAEEFPIIPSLEGSEQTFRVETEVLCRGLSQVVGVAGQSQTRPEISGVLFVLGKQGASVAATDSFRLAERKFVLEKEGAVEQSFILPARTARELIAILGERPGKTTMHVSSTQAVFVYEAAESPSKIRIQIVSRLIEGEYPRYEDVIPSSHKTLISVAKNELLNHLRAAGIFAGKTQEVRLSVDPQKKEIVFFSENTEAGTHRSVLRAEISGEQVEVAFNWRFVSEGLAQIKEDGVEFGLNGEDGAALLRPRGEASYLYVVMPIKA